MEFYTANCPLTPWPNVNEAARNFLGRQSWADAIEPWNRKASALFFFSWVNECNPDFATVTHLHKEGGIANDLPATVFPLQQHVTKLHAANCDFWPAASAIEGIGERCSAMPKVKSGPCHGHYPFLILRVRGLGDYSKGESHR